ncbi:MAG: hypothetical protein ABI696_07320 [Rubrivivax sp.]
MNTTTRTTVMTVATAVAALFGASTAFAQEATPDAWPTVSIASRADVSSDARAALRAGTLPGGEADAVYASNGFMSTLSRAQVQAEAIAARRLGVLDRGEVTALPITAAQRDVIRQAGLMAVSSDTVAQAAVR